MRAATGAATASRLRAARFLRFLGAARAWISQRLGRGRGDDDRIGELLRYPDDGARSALRDRGAPRLLVVTPPHLPPPGVDPLEDWAWGTASRSDLDARLATLEARRRAREKLVPTLDLAGRLVVDGATVRLSPTEAVLAGRLLADYGEVVGREALTRVAWPLGRARARTLDTRMMRLRRRLAAVGLPVRTVRARGWLLERLDGTPTTVALAPTA